MKKNSGEDIPNKDLQQENKELREKLQAILQHVKFLDRAFTVVAAKLKATQDSHKTLAIANEKLTQEVHQYRLRGSYVSRRR